MLNNVKDYTRLWKMVECHMNFIKIKLNYMKFTGNFLVLRKSYGPQTKIIIKHSFFRLI